MKPNIIMIADNGLNILHGYLTRYFAGITEHLLQSLHVDNGT